MAGETAKRMMTAGLGAMGTLASIGVLGSQEPGRFGSTKPGSTQVFVLEDLGIETEDGAPAQDGWNANLLPSPDPTRFPVAGLYLPEPVAPRSSETIRVASLSTDSTPSSVSTNAAPRNLSTSNTRPVVTGKGVTYRIPANVGTTTRPTTTTRTTASTGNKTVFVPEDSKSPPRVGSTQGGRTVITVEDFEGSRGGTSSSSGFDCAACPVVIVPEDYGSKSPPNPTEHCPTYDSYGYDEEGFNRDGYNRQGYDRDGFNRQGYNRLGFDSAGYNKDGYNKSGYDREGYARDGYNKNGIDRDGNRRA